MRSGVVIFWCKENKYARKVNDITSKIIFTRIYFENQKTISMTVEEISSKLSLKVLGGNGGIQNQVTGGYTSDLLSDVMGFVQDGNIWITLQTHKNVMAIASLREVSAVILVKGFQPEADMLEKANEENIPVLSTDLQAFEISGRLYQLLHS
jgi:predicted transcriptional regulator